MDGAAHAQPAGLFCQLVDPPSAALRHMVSVDDAGLEPSAFANALFARQLRPVHANG